MENTEQNLGYRVGLRLAEIKKGHQWLADEVCRAFPDAKPLTVGKVGALIKRNSRTSEDAVRIASVLGVMTEWLIDGTGPKFRSKNDDFLNGSRIGVATVPLLSWVRAGEFCQSPGAFTLQDGEEMHPVPVGCSKNAYALEVKGDSMDVPGGYHPGEIIVIDPDVSVVPGDDVVATDSEGLTLKRYKEDERGKPYLLQLNGNKIIEPAGEWHVCGKVIYSMRKR